MGEIRRKRLDEPDQIREFPHGYGSVVRVGSLAIGRGVLEPGWRWSLHVGPQAGTASCQIHHLQLLLSGRFGVRMNSGEEVELRAGDVFEVPPGHDSWVIGDEPAVLLDFYGHIEDFAMPTPPERVLSTLLMTDIVDSTATAERLGDEVWKQQLANHNRVIRGRLERFRGSEVNTTGDGFLATFQSPMAAVRCAEAIVDATRDIDVPVRIGIHTGEIDVTDDDVGGVAVHATSRITALAGANEIVVSAVTHALVANGTFRFEPRGSHRLKGIEAPMEVFRLGS
jgi:class 3 adenylate cyclase